jgi:hypothetical protein
VARVVADGLDDSRLDDLYDIGVDEVSYRKQHHYLTLVIDHDSGTIVWADEGRDSAALTRFFNELGPARAANLQAISIDMSPDDARRFKHARWALLKRPEDLTDTQADQLAAIQRAGGKVWRAYRLKEALRAILDPDLTPAEAAVLFDRYVSWAQRCRLGSFVKLPHPAQTTATGSSPRSRTSMSLPSTASWPHTLLGGRVTSWRLRLVADAHGRRRDRAAAHPPRYGQVKTGANYAHGVGDYPMGRRLRRGSGVLFAPR